MSTPPWLTSFTRSALDESAVASPSWLRVVPHRGRFLVSALATGPAGRPPFEPFPMPPLPGGAFERMTRLLRVVWRRSGCCAAWLLYLDPRGRRWHPHLPPQPWRQDEPALARFVLGISGGNEPPKPPPPGDTPDAPAADWLLAGTYSVSPSTDCRLLERQLPGHDGLSLFWHPSGWADATALLTALGRVWRLPLHEVVCDASVPSAAADPHDPPDQWEVYERPWISWAP